MSALLDHLATGLTSVCRCWRVARRDGVVLGFTDHDGALAFDGVIFRPEAGMACPAVLGDGRCRFDLAQPGYRIEAEAISVERGQRFVFAPMEGVQARWFERGRLFVRDGAAAGLEGVVKHDQTRTDGTRVIELWEPVRAQVAAGDLVRLEAGCDKRVETCKSKFANLSNFRGFPFVPGEDWLVAIPATQAGVVAG